MIELGGIYPALTTPFVRGWLAADRLQVDLERYERVGLVSGRARQCPYPDASIRTQAAEFLHLTVSQAQ